ncbi:hypothetical protein SAMN02745168_1385 [Papillibacter cinnamivorans DSM 12816]|uniref:Uncharacterized protein n=1 Tax=Papillibacter cinnamivorans DSM 12816 TaxID=1122930 RepID=A0A1W2A227_9FIRM|nr:hypothetical protein SAMN02745168_1385 [Papillibacter cinnamivorans DSM 12816]
MTGALSLLYLFRLSALIQPSHTALKEKGGPKGPPFSLHRKPFRRNVIGA